MAEQKGWGGGVTDEMVAEELHAAAVRELRERARTHTLGRTFREWKKVGTGHKPPAVGRSYQIACLFAWAGQPIH